MGFADEFEEEIIPKLKHSYVRYRVFNKMLRGMASANNGAKEFTKNFEAEVDRLSRFVSSTLENIWMRVDSIGEELPVDALDPNAQKISTYRVRDIEKDIDAVGSDILQLATFSTQNKHALERLCSKFRESDDNEGNNATDLTQYYEQCTQLESQMESLLVFLSDLYARARRVKSNKDGGDAVWVPPESFERKTTKYWVKKEDIMKVKFEIIKRLPLLIFGRKQGAKESRKKGELMFVTEKEGLRDSQSISSVYYDSPDLHVYHNRLLRHDKASLVRVRWYGKRDPKQPDFPLFVERKVHREFWTGHRSVKERCTVQQQYVQSVMNKGTLPPDVTRADKNGEFLSEVYKFLSKRGEKQSPMVRTQYERSAFQEATSNAVRISIDCELKMIREGSSSPKKSGDWCRDVSCDIAQRDIVNFPYAVLEVKLQDEPGQWVNDLTEGGMLIAVPKFSKFQQGMALLYPQKLRNTPWWFLPDKNGGMSSATFEEMADADDPYLSKGNPAMFYDANGNPEAPAAVQKHGQDLLSVKVDRCKPALKHSKFENSIQNSGCFNCGGNNTSPRVERGLTVMCMPISSLGRNLSRKFSSSDKFAKHSGTDDTSSDDHMVTPRASAIVRTRIEPKTFFANERTFLSWLQVSVIVIFMAFSLMDGSSLSNAFVGGSSKSERKADETRLHASQVSGALLAPIGIAFMLYALYMHRMRTMQILRRETVRFDDQRGPVLVVSGLAIACVVAYGISLSGIIA
eukprot:CAMPEP_0198241892 /NCGR_PEP_ID=MMETSP1446-20131203/7108_1 /TAXON_ID=1461542 ORGANISM="Unidentified sp, Strain CCMP2111" /NCGR_SAMPLE_ID=MMETSP1446 /ASSEMBLY_ACC=CAM_ASM_001112 /LENGTH=743 /DNA_ID=CAMNT_0043924821 /DNA_START=269 /DNA_END=2503 /DNA_ORIENTATION=+